MKKVFKVMAISFAVIAFAAACNNATEEPKDTNQPADTTPVAVIDTPAVDTTAVAEEATPAPEEKTATPAKKTNNNKKATPAPVNDNNKKEVQAAANKDSKLPPLADVKGGAKK